MLFNVIDKKIREAFSQAAMHYDMLTSLHKEIGRELTRKIADIEECQRILDVGMGTGWFTKRLAMLFPDALVVGLDFSEGMIDEAKKAQGSSFKIVQADAARLPFHNNVFDIITSNLAYQWVEDLPLALGLCHEQLKSAGLLCLTMFGHDTFRELFEAMSASTDRSIAWRRLADKNQVEAALVAAGFHNVIVSSERIKVRFEDMLDLVKWIKSIGANAVPNEAGLGKEMLRDANEYYNSHFKDRLGVTATFEVLWVEAAK